MKHFGKLLSLFLVLTLCMSMFSFTSNTVFAQDTQQSKISPELQKVLDELENDDLVSICIWIEDIDYEQVESITLLNTGFSEKTLLENSYEIYKSLDNNAIQNVVENAALEEDFEKKEASDSTLDKITSDSDYLDILKGFYETNYEAIEELSKNVDIYISEKRAIARNEYNKQNKGFVEEYLKDAKITFLSQYAPMIIGETSKQNVLDLDNVELVESISVYTEVETHDDGNMNVSIPSIGGAYTRDTSGFNGMGVRIGQIESGRPETGISELSSTSITRGGTNNNTPHASLVAAIMAGKTGMAPKAQLYCTTVDNFYANAEWLISSNVTVINRSNSGSNNGTYDNVAKWVDHIINQHNVSWVQTPGNSGPDAYVCSPGNAYNVITVGSINDRGTVSVNDDTYVTSSNYKIGSGMPSKPDVVAPGSGFSVTGGETMSGTSFAAPHVTGMIAQMQSFTPALKLRPDAIKAAVLASCDRKESGESMNGITAKEGSGVINAINAANSISNLSAQQTYYTTTGSSISFNFYPLSTGTKTIAISWLKRNTGSGTNHTTVSSPTLTDFDLKVYDSSGNLVASSVSVYNNAELVRFNATTTSVYTVKITRYTNNSTSERISLAHVR